MNDDRLDTQSINFSAMLFLDPYILQQGQIDIPQPSSFIPAHILHLLGDIIFIHLCASKFFAQDHTWMPFVSKHRFYSYHLPSQSTIPNRPETILLLLAVKLIITLPPTNPRNPQTSLYQAIKHYCLEVETSNVPSLPILQAEILIALYEMGHGIYPAAYLSIGACARYAYALGINCNKRLNVRRVLTMLEVEERLVLFAHSSCFAFYNVQLCLSISFYSNPRSAYYIHIHLFTLLHMILLVDHY